MKDPKVIEKKEKLLQLVQAFCREHLDEECEQLAIKMVEKLGRKRNVPFLTGKLEVWAAGIIHALGTINFLFDKNSQPFSPFTILRAFLEPLRAPQAKSPKPFVTC